MTEKTWQDRIVGARMSVDREFTDRIEASSFSRQQWGLVMTAVDFEIQNPDDADEARIVANTDKLGSVLPEMDRIEEQMSGMQGGGSQSGAGGILDTVKSAFGLVDSGGDDAAKEQEAASLAQDYADELQRHLEESGRWDEVRKVAARNA